MAVKNIAIEIWKGEERTFRFFADDVPTLTDYKAFLYLMPVGGGIPILTKTSSPVNGIVLHLTDRFIDVTFSIAEFAYAGSIVAGIYPFELWLEYNLVLPRLVGSGNLTVHDSVNEFV